jgi:hypothetical protein
MTRGMTGTFIFCTDAKVAELLRKSLEASGYRGFSV